MCNDCLTWGTLKCDECAGEVPETQTVQDGATCPALNCGGTLKDTCFAQEELDELDE